MPDVSAHTKAAGKRGRLLTQPPPPPPDLPPEVDIHRPSPASLGADPNGEKLGLKRREFDDLIGLGPMPAEHNPFPVVRVTVTLSNYTLTTPDGPRFMPIGEDGWVFYDPEVMALENMGTIIVHHEEGGLTLDDWRSLQSEGTPAELRDTDELLRESMEAAGDRSGLIPADPEFDVDEEPDADPAPAE